MATYIEEDLLPGEVSDAACFTDKQIKTILPSRPVRKGIPVGGFGPFSFDVTPDLVAGKITIKVFFYGVSVGKVDATEDQANIELGPNLGCAKASITITIDWEHKRLVFSAKACVRNFRFRWSCTKYSGVFYCWN